MISEIVIKVITGSWCSQCTVLKRSLDDNDIEYKAVDVDDFENQEYIAKLGVRALPTLVIEKNEEVVFSKSGLIPVKDIVDQINLAKGIV